MSLQYNKSSLFDERLYPASFVKCIISGVFNTI